MKGFGGHVSKGENLLCMLTALIAFSLPINQPRELTPVAQQHSIGRLMDVSEPKHLQRVDMNLTKPCAIVTKIVGFSSAFMRPYLHQPWFGSWI